jgi:hypothetical protein
VSIVFSIESLTVADIEHIERFGKTIIAKINGETGKCLPILQQKALVGYSYAKPESFEILRGEKMLLNKIVHQTAQIVAEHGYAYFNVDRLSEPLDKKNIVWL